MTSSPSGAALVATAYDALLDVLADVDEERSWAGTGCLGWSVRDLTQHCLGDAQRALVALHTPADEPPDRDAADYWSDWGGDAEGAAHGRRNTRVAASMFLHWPPLRDLYAETARAVVRAAVDADPTAAVRTQGHVLLVDDLLRTLCVEATVHHLDLVVELPDAPGPAVDGLGEVRRVLDGLLDAAPATGWTDERYARVGTGRARPTAAETRDLGPLLDRLPVFS